MSFIQKLKNMHNLNIAIKEAFDSLPSAVCYFTSDGSIKLCNTAMYEIYRMISGRDLQSFAELTLALVKCGRTTEVIRDGNIFLFPGGRALQYSVQEIGTADGRTYTETIFTDVTELYAKRRELEQQSEEMKQMYAELKTLSGQLLEITREQEILNMKAHLHDQMNMGIAAIRQVLQQNVTSEEVDSAITRFRRATRILQEETMYPQNDLSEFIRDAKVAGVHVNISGRLPEEEPLPLLIALMREACINAARYADASVLNISSEMTESTVTVQIMNDGKIPESNIVPRGGLKDLGVRIGKAGGTMKIQSLPEFVLTVILPVGRQGRGDAE